MRVGILEGVFQGCHGVLGGLQGGLLFQLRLRLSLEVDECSPCRGGEEGLHQSPELAFRWGLRAAERGHVDAQFNTGVFYENGEGVEVGAYSR